MQTFLVIYALVVAISCACLFMYFYGAWKYLMPSMMIGENIVLNTYIMEIWVLASPLFLVLVVIYHAIFGVASSEWVAE